MKKFQVILEKIEVLIYLWFSIKVLPLHFFVPYNFCFFLFDFSLVFLLFGEWFLFEKAKKNSEQVMKKYYLFRMRVWGILSVIILAKYTDIFENIFSAMFE